ncbi:MAG: OB-fold domain-containing protein [Gemmatimonadota bacterium]
MTRVLGDQWVLPELDESTRRFFTAGVLTFQQCRACSHVQHPPEDVCEACQGLDFGWFESRGQGRIESVAVVYHPVHPTLADQVPYAIVLVSIDDVPDILVAGNVQGTPADAVRIGDRVRVVFARVSNPQRDTELRIPHWEVVSP